MFDTESETETETICPACGSTMSYCLGHGESADPDGATTLSLHDKGFHFTCHEDADCQDVFRLSDGAVVSPGDRAFNYYDMKSGTIGQHRRDGWYDFHSDAGGQTTLNGERMCSIETAKGKGWL